MENFVGVRFRPTEEELLGYFLANKNNKLLQESESWPIKYCDLYGKQEPWQIWESFGGHKLRDGEFLYFFTHLKKTSPKSSRIQRTIGSGTWHGDSGSPILDSKTNKVLGHIRKFKYRNEKSNDNGEWLMQEFSLVNHGSDDYVLCRIKKGGRTGKRNRTEDSAGKESRVLCGEDCYTVAKRLKTKHVDVCVDELQKSQSIGGGNCMVPKDSLDVLLGHSGFGTPNNGNGGYPNLTMEEGEPATCGAVESLDLIDNNGVATLGNGNSDEYLEALIMSDIEDVRVEDEPSDLVYQVSNFSSVDEFFINIDEIMAKAKGATEEEPSSSVIPVESQAQTSSTVEFGIDNEEDREGFNSGEEQERQRLQHSTTLESSEIENGLEKTNLQMETCSNSSIGAQFYNIDWVKQFGEEPEHVLPYIIPESEVMLPERFYVDSFTTWPGVVV